MRMAPRDLELAQFMSHILSIRHATYRAAAWQKSNAKVKLMNGYLHRIRKVTGKRTLIPNLAID